MECVLDPEGVPGMRTFRRLVSAVPILLALAMVAWSLGAGGGSGTLDAAGGARGEAGEFLREGSKAEMLAAREDWFYGQRAAPGLRIPALARAAALREARILARQTTPGISGRSTSAAAPAAGAWVNIGPFVIDSDDETYNDPAAGTPPNAWHDVSGRVTSLDVNRKAPKTVYVGTANGGIWKSTNGGQTWNPVGDQLESLAIGDVAISPKVPRVVFAGTGEPNTSSDAYWGVGIFKSINGGASWTKLGGQHFDRATVYQIYVRGGGQTVVMAATNRGLFRSSNGGVNWRRVLAPGGQDRLGNFITDLVPLYGAKGHFLAAVGWRAGNPANGLYQSTDDGRTWAKIAAPQGFPQQGNIGRISLATRRGSAGLIYAVVQDAVLMTTAGANTVLNGVYKTTTGPAGPWQAVATSQVFASDENTALSPAKIGPTYQPGIQAWYNQYVVIDPTNANHVIVGLEEVYESTDGGTNWDTIGRYWNVCLSNPGPPGCYADPDAHPTTHPDQHAAVFTSLNGVPKLYVGGDGGVWSQPGTDYDNDSWTNLNQGLSTVQPYYAEASNGPNFTVYAGTQDNGTIKYTGSGTWPEVWGGDGGDVMVAPDNPNHTYQEYVYLDMSKSSNGGQTWTNIAPEDAGSSATARFIAPFDMDPINKNHLVAVGQRVWVSNQGINTTSSSWQAAFDQGAGHVGTAVAVRGSRIYTGWCGPCNPAPDPTDPSGATFARGIATNRGGTWHQAAAAGLPNRYITSITIDPANGSHIFVTLSGFSRRWVPYAGVGHVFESVNGGASFTDISANLPDAPANDTVLVGSRLIVGTDVGVFERVGNSWAVLGTGLPAASVLDMAKVPNDDVVLAVTHGRGVWTLDLS